MTTKPLHICYCYGPPKFQLFGETNLATVVSHCSGKIRHIIAYLPIRLHFNENLIFEMSFRSACSCSVLSRPSFTMLCINVDSTTGLPRKISSREKIHSYTTWHYDSLCLRLSSRSLHNPDNLTCMFCFQTALSIYRSFPVALFFLQRSF